MGHAGVYMAPWKLPRAAFVQGALVRWVELAQIVKRGRCIDGGNQLCPALRGEPRHSQRVGSRLGMNRQHVIRIGLRTTRRGWRRMGEQCHTHAALGDFFAQSFAHRSSTARTRARTRSGSSSGISYSAMLVEGRSFASGSFLRGMRDSMIWESGHEPSADMCSAYQAWRTSTKGRATDAVLR